MKKYNILLAMIALVLASLACQTIMGGGDNNPTIPNVPNLTEVPENGEVPTASSGDTNGGEYQFPVTSDAYNVNSMSDVVTFQTKMSSDDVIKFYRDQFTGQGYTEDPSLTATFGKTFTIAFKGHSSGKVIYVVGADGGDGSLYITITLG